MKTVFTLAFLLTFITPQWLTNFDDAKNDETQEHKYILLNFSGSDWCGPCIKMKKEVFENEEFLSLAEKQLVLVQADFPRSKKNQLPQELTRNNETLAEKYNPKGKFPLTLLLDAKGNMVKEWDGYVFASQEKFISDLQRTIVSR
jgi:thioredoxin-related protein